MTWQKFLAQSENDGNVKEVVAVEVREPHQKPKFYAFDNTEDAKEFVRLRRTGRYRSYSIHHLVVAS